MDAGEPFLAHAFEYACAQNNDHGLTKPKRMNRTIKDATVKRFYYETHDHLRPHMADFVTASNFARRPKPLKGLTSYEYVCKLCTKEPQRFTLNPLHHRPGYTTTACQSISEA